MSRTVSAMKLALAFLTVIPLGRGDGPVSEADLKASRFGYPLVGVMIGFLLALLSEALRSGGATPSVAAFLLVASLALLTGGLHLDGLADTFDGLFLWGSAERRLAVMRDPHIGSHGVSAIALVLLGKYAVLADLNGQERPVALFGALAVSRTLILISAGIVTYARPQGTGRLVIEATTARDTVGATVVALIFSSAVAGGPGLIAGVGAVILALTLTKLAARRLGGITGDILGTIVELGELVYLLLFSLLQAFRSPW